MKCQSFEPLSYLPCIRNSWIYVQKIIYIYIYIYINNDISWPHPWCHKGNISADFVSQKGHGSADVGHSTDLGSHHGGRTPRNLNRFFLSWDLVIVVGGIQGTKCSRMFPLNGNRSTQRRGAKNHKSTVAVANTVDW